jgi:hypothetical protein
MKESKETSRLIFEEVLGFSKLEIVGHALSRMKERGVTTDEVIDTIRTPDRGGLPTQKGRKRVRKNRSAVAAVDVVYEELRDRIRVITVIDIDRIYERKHQRKR